VLLFVNKKKQKNFDFSGVWALSATLPMARQSKSFLLLFSKKEVVPSFSPNRNPLPW
jgi:hypothetical protein